jgi:hypothetical protein
MAFENPLIGQWMYRSFNNVTTDPKPFDDILFGEGTLTFTEAPMQLIAGTIGTPGSWGLTLQGSMTYGNPFCARFQGTGVNNGEEWVYDYEVYLVKAWPNGVNQVDALVGSVVRTVPHSGGDGSIHPAGVVASVVAVRLS